MTSLLGTHFSTNEVNRTSSVLPLCLYEKSTSTSQKSSESHKNSQA